MGRFVLPVNVVCCDKLIHVRLYTASGYPEDRQSMTSLAEISVVTSLIITGKTSPFEDGKTVDTGAKKIPSRSQLSRLEGEGGTKFVTPTSKIYHNFEPTLRVGLGR